MVAIHVLYEVVVTKVIITIVAEAVYRGYAVGYYRIGIGPYD